MKHNLLIPVSVLMLSGTAFAQKSIVSPKLPKHLANEAVKTTRHAQDAHVVQDANLGAPQQRAVTTANIGLSTYQLQTNNSVQRHIVNNPDNTISTAFTFSNTSTWADRGTGYVYFDGTAWGAAPTTRIEPVRTGWPALVVMGDGSEAIITHNTAGSDLHLSRRPVKGTGAWTHDASIIGSDAAYGNFWPTAAVGGPTNQTIHLLSISNPTDGAATPTPVFYQGQQGAVTYSRSLDGGLTWDILHEIHPDHDSSEYYGFSADSYVIDARGNTVAYAVGTELTDLFIMKSTDNGATWTKTMVNPFPIPMFNDQLTDVDGDGVADTITTNDGSLSILIDDNDDVHVWFGNMRVIDQTPGDGSYSYFPGTLGLMYWNENMGASAPVMIASAEDIDGSMTIDITGWGQYFNSLSGFPTTGIDAGGTIHLVYSAIVEGTDFNGKALRNLYHMSSSNNGTTWTIPARVNADEFTEQVYPSMARRAEAGCVKMVYSADQAPGHGAQSTSDDYSDNLGMNTDIIYACYSPAVGNAEIVNLSEGISLYPNPANTTCNITGINPIQKVEVFNSMGARVASVTPNSTNAVLDIANLTSGLYLVNIASGDQKITKTLVIE